MKIAFVSNYPASDIKSWSGTVHYSFAASKSVFSSCELVEATKLDQAINFVRKILMKLGTDILLESSVSWLYGRALAPKMRRLKPDAIIAIASSVKVARLGVDIPIVHVSDATFHAMAGYYTGRSKLSARARMKGELMEQHVLSNCAAAVLASEWAAASARNDYGISPNKIHVVPFGANVAGSVSDIQPREIGPRILLLFVGVSWERKGGSLAYETMKSLRSAGFDAELQVVGCVPPVDVASNPQVVQYGFLNKSDPKSAETIDRLYRAATFLMVPSRQEAYGLVFAEALAYGLPVVATRTGGIPTIVQDGVCGCLMDVEDSHDAYVKAILQLINDPQTYHEYSRQGIRLYSERLTWAAWARRTHQIVVDVVRHDREKRQAAPTVPVDVHR